MMLGLALKEKLRRGEAVIGCFVGVPSPELVEMLGWLGFDFVVIDAEHGHITPQSAYWMVVAAEGSGLCPLVRIPTIDESVIQTYLDLGAAGLFVPRVETVEDLRRLEKAAFYHPLGERGLGHVRAGRYGYRQPVKVFAHQANEALVLVAQVETQRAIEQLEGLVTDPLIDALFIGATDLAQSLGYPGEAHHPAVRAAIETIVQIAGPRKPLGTSAREPGAIADAVTRGFRLILANVHAIVRAGATQYLEAFAAAKGT